MKRAIWQRLISAAAALTAAAAVTAAAGLPAEAAQISKRSAKTSIQLEVRAQGQYNNWDGVSNVSQFKDAEGNFCFAYRDISDSSRVLVYEVINSVPTLKTVLPIVAGGDVGTVLCDAAGHYYMVCGTTNPGDDTSMNTVWITKYDAGGNVLNTIGDNGGSNLNSVTPDSFHTKSAFSSGNCDAAINGNLLTIHYARGMYNGHQSNSIFTINIDSMTNVTPTAVYSSHSFAQRVTKFRDGFLYTSEGDAYPRAFSVDYVVGKRVVSTNDLFHFWIPSGEGQNMSEVNNNYAHLGDLVNIDDSLAALVGTSAPDMNENAVNEKEQIFVQIFNPLAKLNSPDSYATPGERTGTSGRDGDKTFTDYGAKFLPLEDGVYVSNPQAVYDGNGHLVVLFEQTRGYDYDGVWYYILDGRGNVIQDKTQYAKTVHLNPCETPIYANGQIIWAGNRESDWRHGWDQTLYINTLTIQ